MTRYSLIHAFDNVGLTSHARSFPGFPKPSDGTTHKIAPRDGVRLDLMAGDLLSVDQSTGTAEAQILAFDQTGRPALDALGLSARGQMPRRGCDMTALTGWVEANGGDVLDLPASQVPASDDPIVLKSTRAITVWVFRPARPQALVEGGLPGAVTVMHQPAPRSTPDLPPLLGDVREEFTIPRGTARAYAVKQGEYLQIIDIAGQQCSDFTAFRADGLDKGQEWMIDGTATRSMVRRAYPGPGCSTNFMIRTCGRC